MPARRLAFGLTPIASIMRPSAVRRMRIAMTTTMAMAMTKFVGMPSSCPFESCLKGALTADWFCPSVMTMFNHPLIFLHFD